MDLRCNRAWLGAVDGGHADLLLEGAQALRFPRAAAVARV